MLPSGSEAADFFRDARWVWPEAPARSALLKYFERDPAKRLVQSEYSNESWGTYLVIAAFQSVNGECGVLTNYGDNFHNMDNLERKRIPCESVIEMIEALNSLNSPEAVAFLDEVPGIDDASAYFLTWVDEGTRRCAFIHEAFIGPDRRRTGIGAVTQYFEGINGIIARLEEYGDGS